MAKVIPAIIPKKFSDIEEKVSLVKDFVSKVQIDICDGIFASPKTWPYENIDFFNDLISEKESFPFWQDVDYQVHLMVSNPEDVVLNWSKTTVTDVIFHIEATSKPLEVIDILRDQSINVGLSVKPSTPNESFLHLLDKIDFLQIMGSDEIGKNHIPLQDPALLKVDFFRKNFPNLDLYFDIGVNEDTAKDLIKRGVKFLISGSFIFDNSNPVSVINEIENIK